ncbi:hypothetical protein SAMN06265795_104248 [Noviherbaspirillum humi]|uniref:Lipoprotein n=1 Tax=Noviherbaspirillum humi TaxID=1688639 RepID=A0A239G4G6_9BURK|nr:hypothetical protein [Noviherbaspirillum humi]SNS64067.1 hypothetical protein SAMN06265795_104248 [Noviherbaspirillum humi]
MKLISISLLSVFILAGCVVVPDVPVTRVVVQDGGPVHCPPGQAKKGRC